MTGLKEGGDYYIRVIAVNDAGPGAPGVTEPVTVKEPLGKNSFIRNMNSKIMIYLKIFDLVLVFGIKERRMCLSGVC